MQHLIFFCGMLSCAALSAQTTFHFDFTQNQDGWTGDFADYPVGEEGFYELEFQWGPLPSPLSAAENALKIAGNNHSDDLFMFIKRKINGLAPNTAYEVVFDIELASQAPTNAIGVGGAPGEAVILKAGVTLLEPVKINSGGFYLMNIDKSNQSQPGADMDTLGHIGVSDTTSVFTLISRNNFSHPFSVTTDNTGEVWVIIGTDSGYEGLSVLYYNTIAVTFTNPATALFDPLANSSLIFPNPTRGEIHVQAPFDMERFEIYNAAGRLIRTFRVDAPTFDLHENLPAGKYFTRIVKDSKVIHNQIIIID